MTNDDIDRAKAIYLDARKNSPPNEAEQLTRHVLVLQGMCEPYASEAAKAARVAIRASETSIGTEITDKYRAAHRGQKPH